MSNKNENRALILGIKYWVLSVEYWVLDVLALDRNSQLAPPHSPIRGYFYQPRQPPTLNTANATDIREGWIILHKWKYISPELNNYVWHEPNTDTLPPRERRNLDILNLQQIL